MYLFKKKKKIEDNPCSCLFHLSLSLILSLIAKHSKDIKFIKIQFLNYSNIFLATKQNNNNKQTQETSKKKNYCDYDFRSKPIKKNTKKTKTQFSKRTKILKKKEKKSNLEEVQCRKQATLELVVDGKFFDFSNYPLHPNAQNSKPNKEKKEDPSP